MEAGASWATATSRTSCCRRRSRRWHGWPTHRRCVGWRHPQLRPHRRRSRLELGQWNLAGRLGHGDQQRQLLPRKVEAFAGQRVVAVSVGRHHSLALTADGAVWSWGSGGEGVLVHGDEHNQLLPKKVEAFAGQHVVAVSAGGTHSLALAADGSVWSWGWGGNGKLGHGDQQRQRQPKKVEAFAGLRVIAVSAGGAHNLALTAGGAVWSWGFGRSGQLAHGDREHQFAPQKTEMWASRPPTPTSSDGEGSSGGEESDSGSNSDE